ncbi:MAG: PKD domain-containing protein [Cytophagales bacterium]|nr:PKD domain-containing protein [Cytophagales bacterium]
MNTSTGADRYEWDFYSGDLAAMPTVTETATGWGANIPTNITTVFDGTNYYAFFFSRDNNQFLRLNFGSSPDNNPAVTNLGIISGAANRPEPLDFMQEGANWYAFAANTSGSSNLLRLSFGADLNSTPAVTDLGDFGGRLKKPRGLKVAKDKNNYTLVVTNAGDNTLTLIDLGATLAASPGSTSVIKTAPFATANLELISTSLIRDCDEWYGLTVSNATSQVYKLAFGTSLFNTPSISPLPVGIPGTASLFNNQLTYDGGYTAVLLSLHGRMFHLNFGESMANGAPVATDMGQLPLLSGIAGFSLVKYGSKWLGHALSYDNNKVFKLSFPDLGTPLSVSASNAPAGIKYSRSGAARVDLTVYNASGRKSISKNVYVRPVPSVDFLVEGSPAAFTATAVPGDRYVAWNWNFGDGTSASEASPVHLFKANGTYDVTLTATSVCGVTGTVTRKVSVVNNAVLSCPLPIFSLPDTVCAEEPVAITNATIGAGRYEWDFCSGDLTETPASQTPVTIAAANILTDVTAVFDGTSWYGFASSRETNSLFRLEYGSSLSNPPTLVAMGNPGNALSRPEQMKLVKEGTDWYALVVNVNNYTSNFSVVRLKFGNNLRNAPQAERLTAVTPFLQVPRSIALGKDGANTVAVITSYTNNSLVMVRFKGSIAATPAAEDVLVSAPLPGAADGLLGVSIVESCNQWYGVASSYNKKFYKLSFGSHLFSVPSVQDLSHLYDFPFGLGKTVLAKNNDDYLAFVILFNGDLLRYDFGPDLNNPEPRVKRVTYFVGDATGLDLVQHQSESQLIAPDYFSKKVYRFAFPNNCSANFATSTQATPANITYSGGGWQKINLTAYDWNNNVSTLTDSVFVRPALKTDFAVDQQCLGTPARFTATALLNGNQVVSWAWNFGDGKTGTGAAATHTYATAGTYLVTLTATDLCGRIASATQSVRIYRNTTPGFVVPDDFCSNQPLSFADASSVVDDAPASWQWDFGNGATMEGATVTYAYPSAGAYTVTLTIKGVSGCSVSVSKAITVRPGVNVNFTQSALCIGGQTQFVDQSIVPKGAEITSRQWDFGDNSFSSAVSPVHEYTTSGTYKVTLTMTNAAGCTTRRTRDIVIRRLPRVAFSASLACSGELVSFADESNPVEGAITGWQWHFGDPGSGDRNTSTAQQAAHTYAQPGTYTVKLVVLTSHGCTDSLSRTVTVVPSPRADFTYQLDCGTKTVAFAAQSAAPAGNQVVEWYWEFGDGEVSTASNPTHTYGQTGTYPVTLVVTAGTRCRSVMQKTVQVAEAPAADFTLPAPVCAGQPVTLADKSVAAPGDDIVQWQWQVAGQTFTDRAPAVTFPVGTSAAQVTLAVTTASGCRSTVSRQIAVADAPSASFSYQSSANQPLELTFKAAAGGATAWQWDFGDGQTSDSPEPEHAYPARGTYKVTLTVRNAAGCTHTVTQDVTVVKEMQAYVLQLERAAVQGGGSGTKLLVRLLNKGPETLHALSFRVVMDGGVPAEHPWSGSLPPGSALSYTFTPPQVAQGATGETFCVQAKDPQRGTLSNRECANAGNAFTLLNPAPNPTRYQFRLAFILPEAGGVRLEIVDALGRTVATEGSREYPGGYSEKTQFLAHLAKGMYFIRLSYRDQTLLKPLLID